MSNCNFIFGSMFVQLCIFTNFVISCRINQRIATDNDEIRIKLDLPTAAICLLERGFAYLFTRKIQRIISLACTSILIAFHTWILFYFRSFPSNLNGDFREMLVGGFHYPAWRRTSKKKKTKSSEKLIIILQRRSSEGVVREDIVEIFTSFFFPYFSGDLSEKDSISIWSKSIKDLEIALSQHSIS